MCMALHDYMRNIDFDFWCYIALRPFNHVAYLQIPMPKTQCCMCIYAFQILAIASVIPTSSRISLAENHELEDHRRTYLSRTRRSQCQ